MIEVSTNDYASNFREGKPLRILILGTSNSLLRKGWVAGLRDAFPEAQIDNLSVGASPGIQFALSIGLDFTSYDVVFLDSVPNDEEYQQVPHFSGTLGYSSEAFVDRIMFEIASTIAAETCLVVVGFCRKNNLESPSSVYRSRILIAQAAGAQFLDLRQLLLQFGPRVIGKGKDLYEEHPAHPQSPISYFFGSLIGEALIAAARGKGGFSLGKNNAARSYRHNFHAWVADDHVDASKLRLYQNSLLRENYYLIRENEAHDISLPGICIGFNINAPATSCVVGLHSNDRKSIDISCFYDCRDGGFMKIFVPIPHGMALDRLTVTAASAKPAMRGLLSKPTPQPNTPTALALSRLAFWTGTVDVDWKQSARSGGEALALTTALYDRMQNEPGLFPVRSLVGTLRQSGVSKGVPSRALAFFSYHGTVIVYDITMDCCRHVAAPELATNTSLFPVRARIDGATAIFFVVVGGFELTVFIRLVDKRLGCEIEHASPQLDNRFCIVNMNTGVFALQCNHFYLAAEPSGKLVCNRREAREWETFTIGALPDGGLYRSAEIQTVAA
jgi:hypothetical protein